MNQIIFFENYRKFLFLLLVITLFTFTFESCDKKDEVVMSETNQFTPVNLSIDEFIDRMTNSKDGLNSRDNITYADCDVIDYVEEAMNNQYSFPLVRYDDSDYTFETYILDKVNGVCDEREVIEFYDDVQEFAGCHYKYYSGSNKKPIFYDVELISSTSSELELKFTSVVGSTSSSILAQKSFAVGDDFPTGYAYYPTVCDHQTGLNAEEAIEDYTNYNLRPSLSSSPYYFDNISIYYHQSENIYGWLNTNPNDPIPGDRIIDFRTWIFSCINDCNDPNLDWDLYYCIPYDDMNYYLDNVEDISIDCADGLNKDFINIDLYPEGYLGNENYVIDKWLAREYVGIKKNRISWPSTSKLGELSDSCE